jgi:NAD(P)-dependent dehydrogenase (short-subunit alcohol dehydrogenase family)
LLARRHSGDDADCDNREANMTPSYRSALIVGAGDGLSASLARQFAADGLAVTLAARNVAKLERLAAETGAATFACDASKPGDVAALFREADKRGAPDVVCYNASGRVRGPLIELDPEAVSSLLAVTAFGAFLVAQEAARRMLPNNHGAILFTGASAGVKGYARSAPFAMGKFALRGLAQSLARELHPQGIHIAHFVIDGGIRNPGRTEASDRPDSMLDPDAIARTYRDALRQDRSAWSWEVEVRPWVETF